MSTPTTAERLDGEGTGTGSNHRRTKGGSRPKQRRMPRTVGEWFVLAGCLAFLVWFVLPLYVVVATALKGSAAGTDSFLSPPDSIDLAGFSTAWESLHGNLWNSLQIAIPGTVISCLIGALNGFILSKAPFRGSNLLFTLMLMGMFIPFQSIIIPLFQFLSALNLTGTLLGVTLVHIIYGIPITTLIFRNYYAGVPVELVEAARVDGAGMLRTYASIILPISAPAFVVVLMWQFTSAWNDYLFALFFSTSRNGPVTIALNFLASGQMQDYSASMAGALIASVPTLIIYILLGRYFVGGLMAGSVKG